MIMDEQRKKQFKDVKQRLSKIQLVIKKDLTDVRIPQAADADDFIAISREMDLLCLDEWRMEMDSYVKRIEQFQVALQKVDLQAIDDAFHELLDCKVSCHKQFRQK